MPRCRSRRCYGRARSPTKSVAAVPFRSWSRDGCVRASGSAGPARARPGRRSRAHAQALEIRAAAVARPRRPAACGACLWAEFPQSGRDGRRFRQECGIAGLAVAARLRLCRGRHHHAAAAGRQSAPAPFSPRCRCRRHQPARFQFARRHTVLRRLAARADAGGIVGINVGANKDSPDRVADYVALIERFASVASYVTVNISSPNTPGLRNLHQAHALDDLLARVVDVRERVAPNAGPTPVLLKIAPDLSLADLDDVVGIARSRRVDGMIVGNTTLSRPQHLHETAIAKESGGLSGAPLLPLSNRMLAETYVRVEGVFPLVGAGGIDSGAAALSKIR